jgi:hypothetical protein
VLAVLVLYTGAGLFYAAQRNWAMVLIMIGYVTANAGLMLLP